MSDFSLPSPQNKGERFFTEQEAADLLAELDRRSMPLRDMAMLSLKTGARATEIFGITGADIDAAAGVVWLTAKGGKRQFVHADDDIIEMLAGYGRGPGELVFVSRTGKRITAISDTFQRSVDALGLNDGVNDSRKKVWFHTLRHTFASWLAQSGKFTLHEIQSLMRHERIEMTERYAHLMPGQCRDKLKLISEALSSAA